MQLNENFSLLPPPPQKKKINDHLWFGRVCSQFLSGSVKLSYIAHGDLARKPAEV